MFILRLFTPCFFATHSAHTQFILVLLSPMIIIWGNKIEKFWKFWKLNWRSLDFSQIFTKLVDFNSFPFEFTKAVGFIYFSLNWALNVAILVFNARLKSVPFSHECRLLLFSSHENSLCTLIQGSEMVDASTGTVKRSREPAKSIVWTCVLTAALPKIKVEFL